MLVDYAEQKSLIHYLMEENIGWNDGVNYGFSKANGSLLLTINSDVIVEKGWLKNMVNIYFSKEKVGAVNANIYEDGESIITANSGELKILHGACCMFSEKAWHLVGKLDSKNFEFYGTENDWSYRARSMGYKLLLSESSVVNHLGSSKITAGGGLSVIKTGKIFQYIKIRLEGRVKFRAYNYKLKDWLSREILSEFKHAYINGYFRIFIATYIRVLFNIKNILLARKQRSLKRKEALKILAYDETKQP